MNEIEQDLFRRLKFTTGELGMYLRAYLDSQTKVKKRLIDRNINELKDIIDEYLMIDYRNCLICGKPFQPNSHNQLYCSKDCRKIALSEDIEKYNKKTQADSYPCSGMSELKTIPPMICLNCSAPKCRYEL